MKRSFSPTAKTIPNEAPLIEDDDLPAYIEHATEMHINRMDDSNGTVSEEEGEDELDETFE